MRQVLKKSLEQRIDTNHIFIDFKIAFPERLIGMGTLPLDNTRNVVSIGEDFSLLCDTKLGFRQGNALTCDFFILFIES